MDERTITDAHGVEVFTRWWPVDDPTALVLISHGASEHSGRYDRFARALNEAGAAVVALDHRGHGRSVASPGPAVMGAGGGQAVVDDLHELRAAAAERFGADVPVVFFGHSLGSLIGLAYLVQHSTGLAGAVLCGFPADPSDPKGTAALLREVAAAGMRDQPLAELVANAPSDTPARTPFDWLSRDEAEVDAYVADPMCGDGNPLTYGYLLDLAEVVAEGSDRLASIGCPVLVIAGDQDPAGAMGAHPAKLAELLRDAGIEVEVQLYEGARHELLNETNRDEVTADLVAWLKRRR